jgi:ABC-type transport system substrate-binding protein
MIEHTWCKRVLAVGVIAAMIVSGFVFLLPSTAAESVPHVPTAGKLLRIASQDDAKGLNPYAVNDVWSSNIIYNIWDGLVSRDWKTQKNQPWIAVGWGVDKDQPANCDTCNITVEYKLGDWENKWGGDPGIVYFHDGVKATLEDVLFSYGMTLYNPRWISSVDSIIWDKDWTNPPYGDSSFMKVTVAGKQGWLAVKKVNEHTLQFRLSKPYADFFDDTINVIVFPKHVWESHINILTGEGDYMTWDMGYSDQTGEASGMIGSGAYVFEKWIKLQYAQEKKFENVNGHSYFDWTKLPRVDDYGKRLDPEQPAYDPAWTKNHPTPYIDGLLFKIYKTTEAASLAIAANPPEVDFVAWSIPPTMVSDMQKNPNIKLWFTSEPGFFYNAFNMRKKTYGYADFQGQNFTDVGKPLRKAIAYSTDKGSIVSTLLQGYGKAALGPVSPDNKIWHNDSLPAYGVNEALAKKYLDDAGWKDTNGDGWREFPEIGGAEIPMLTPEASYDPIRAVAGQMIATQAQKVGINLKSVPMAFGEIVSRLDRHDFQVFILGWRIGGSDPGYLYAFFHSQGGQNYPGYNNATFDNWLNQYRQIFDKPKRIQLIKDAQGLLVEDLPYNVLYYRTNIEASRKDKFTGWVQGTSGIWNGWSLLLLDTPKTPMSTTLVAPRLKIGSGDTMDLTVQVKDKTSGASISDADMTLKIDSGTDAAILTERNGYPAVSPDQGVTLIGKTDSSGYFKATFNAKAGLQDNKTATVSALAAKSGYDQENTAAVTITVIKVGSHAISIAEIGVDPDTMTAGENAQVTVKVVDETGKAVQGATVNLNASLGTVNPSSTTTDSEGKATVSFTVPQDAAISDGTKVRITAVAKLTGMEDSDPMTKEVTVNPYTKPPGPPIPFIDSAVVVISLLAAAAVFAVFAARKRFKA